MTKKCFCAACETSPECEVNKYKSMLKLLVFGNSEKFIKSLDYANRTKDELSNSLKLQAERILKDDK